MRPILWRTVAAVLTVVAGVVITPALRSEPLVVRVTLAVEVASEPVDGRLLVFFSQRGRGAPINGPSWFDPEPFFGIDAVGFAPGESRTVDDTADAFPDVISTLPAGSYRVQAVLDHGFYHQHHAREPGNYYSDVASFEVGSADVAMPLDLTLDRVVQDEPFPESKWVHEVVVRSGLLSQFHGRDVLQRAAVVLPASYYDQPDRRYPTIYAIGGFSSSHRSALRYRENPPERHDGEVEFVRVILSGDCKWGHHVYADSATNGPRGTALVREMIPHIESTYRVIAAPTARFVTGHSSGGWAALWLQVTYPDEFNGVWSTSPDPVDFRDYQQVNLYADPPLSLYFDATGERRPIARRGTEPVLWYQDFGRMDDVLGRGGQLRSFEAVFSPPGSDGLPRRLWDRTTGQIDPVVARAWQAYDIRLKIERNWTELEPKLRGKLHITTGSLDTFYLEGAVRLLGQSLKELGSDAEVTIVEGAHHGNVRTAEYIGSMTRQMSAAFLEKHPSP